MKKDIKESGFSLISTLIGLAVLGGFSVVMYSFFASNIKVQKQIAIRGELLNLEEYIKNQFNCPETQAQANCNSYGKKNIAVIGCNGDEFIKRGNPPTLVGGRHYLRALCGKSGDPTDIYFETTQKKHDGTMGAWKDLFSGIPMNCTSGASSNSQVSDQSQLNLIFSHDMSLYDMFPQNDSAGFFDRCDDNTYLWGGQKGDHYVNLPSGSNLRKTPVFKGERVVIMPYWHSNTSGTREIKLVFKDWNDNTMWIFHAGHMGSQPPPGANIEGNHWAITPTGTQFRSKHLHRNGDLYYVRSYPQNSYNFYVPEYTVPVTKDGYLLLDMTGNIAQYAGFAVQHVFNPEASIDYDISTVSGCNRVSQARKDFIVSKMPSRCQDKVRAALDGKVPWSN